MGIPIERLAQRFVRWREGAKGGDIVKCHDCRRLVLVGSCVQMGKSVFCDESCADNYAADLVW